MRLHASITEARENGFVSTLRKHHAVTIGPYEVQDVEDLLLITEVPEHEMRSRWWKGTVLRVGTWTEGEITFDWYTADLEKFLNRYPDGGIPRR
jgi:hypothetical protein